MRKFEPVIAEQIDIFLRQLAQVCKQNELAEMTILVNRLGLDISGALSFGHSFELQTSEKNRAYHLMAWLWPLNRNPLTRITLI